MAASTPRLGPRGTLHRFLAEAGLTATLASGKDTLVVGRHSPAELRELILEQLDALAFRAFATTGTRHRIDRTQPTVNEVPTMAAGRAHHFVAVVRADGR